MNDLTAADFTQFFQDIHGYPPFPWQRRLTEQVLETGKWPEVIDLPTGSGKTAVLDTAIFALAARPDDAPRRVVFVIDRRIVVDQVHKRARRIQESIGEKPTLAPIRERLSRLSGGDGDIIGVAALRGGIPIDDKWTHRPDTPSCIVSTVDQFGSKLLFRGYGVSPGMRPIHAGLAGNDCLVILDEVHLSVPFAQPLSGIASLSNGKLSRRFQVVEMSATPSNPQATRFTLEAADSADSAELQRRVKAQKSAKLVLVGSPSKPPHEVIPREVLKIAKKELGDRVRSVGVIVNRVRTARETHKALSEAGYDAHLITGRMRPLDRAAKLEDLADVVEPDPDQRTYTDDLTFVVSTQAIEVGADFSFDALITECAPIDSLKQRFGRLDRRGFFSAVPDNAVPDNAVPDNGDESVSSFFASDDNDGFSETEPLTPPDTAAQGWILGPKSVVASRKPDPIYGESVKAAWNELEARSPDGVIDVGPLALQNFPEDAYAPKKDAPLLLKTHIDAWVQTSPEPIVQPSLEWFLHGLEVPSNSDVSIVWRWDRSSEVLRLVPPRQAEFLQIPIQAAKSWLADEAEAPVADINLTQDDSPSNDAVDSARSSGWVRWDGFQDGTKKIRVGEIKPGDIIIVSPEKGGLLGETWSPATKETVSDLGDSAQLAYGKRATLRLDRRLFPKKSNVSSPKENEADSLEHDDGDKKYLRPPTPAGENEADASPRDQIKEWLDEQTELPKWATDALERLDLYKCELRPVGVSDEDPSAGYYVLAEKKVDAAALDGSDSSGSLTGTGIKLSSHLEGVGERAERFAASLGLSKEIQEDLRLAGSLHDLGKVDKRFQALLVGGDRISLALLDEPLAKSQPDTPKTRTPENTTPEDLKYPKGMRHEVASVAMIESNEDVLAEAHDKDLVLHLVGTHHGYGRPLPPVLEDPNPQPLSYDVGGRRMQASSNLAESQIALNMADRFWKLTAQYGHHGLAWLEAILRLADHRQSEAEAETQQQ